MKIGQRAGMVGLMLALCGTTTPQAGAAPEPAAGPERDPASIDARLGAVGEALRSQADQAMPLETADGTVMVAQSVFLNYAPTFRNRAYGFRNAVPASFNTGIWNNAGIHFLNNVPSFRNSYNGWRNAYPGWINHGAFYNSGAGFRNWSSGFRNSYNGWRNNVGGWGNGGGNGAFRNGGHGGFRNNGNTFRNR